MQNPCKCKIFYEKALGLLLFILKSYFFVAAFMNQSFGPCINLIVLIDNTAEPGFSFALTLLYSYYLYFHFVALLNLNKN